uniref:hypothetical protein n=1 Tax=Navicula tsukamotoi TaxID=2018706 RepID=UPI00202812E7|nr:hypothetical protein NDC64_mgp12 [Navicula tsukamotoi]QYB23116.1 hypothetical protein [Navicula tsukamotoi]
MGYNNKEATYTQREVILISFLVSVIVSIVLLFLFYQFLMIPLEEKIVNVISENLQSKNTASSFSSDNPALPPEGPSEISNSFDLKKVATIAFFVGGGVYICLWAIGSVSAPWTYAAGGITTIAKQFNYGSELDNSGTIVSFVDGVYKWTLDRVNEGHYKIFLEYPAAASGTVERMDVTGELPRLLVEHQRLVDIPVASHVTAVSAASSVSSGSFDPMYSLTGTCGPFIVP